MRLAVQGPKWPLYRRPLFLLSFLLLFREGFYAAASGAGGSRIRGSGEGATAEYNTGAELADLGGHGEDGRRPPDCLLHNLGPPQRQLEILLRPSLLLPARTNSLRRPYLPTSPIPLEVALPPLLSLLFSSSSVLRSR